MFLDWLKQRKRAADPEEPLPAPRPKRVTKAKAGSSTEAATKKSKAAAVISNAPQTNTVSIIPVVQPFDAFFSAYSDDGEGKVMTMEGIQRLFEDSGISLEGVSPFLLAWACQAPEFGEFKAAQWENLQPYGIGSAAQVKALLSDIEMVFYQDGTVDFSDSAMIPPTEKKATKTKKAAPKANGVAQSMVEYNKEPLRKLVGTPGPAFKDFYLFCFGLMKKQEARVMEMEMATATWSVTLLPKFSIMEQLLEFIAVHPSYKAVNKDLWGMTLEFVLTIEERDLSQWNDDESWPSLLDEFVAWEKKRRLPDSQGDVPMA